MISVTVSSSSRIGSAQSQAGRSTLFEYLFTQVFGQVQLRLLVDVDDILPDKIGALVEGYSSVSKAA